MPSLIPEPSTALLLAADPVELGALNAETIGWLLDQGISVSALATPWAIGAARVVIEPTRRYTPNPIGEFALILPCISGAGLVDLVCWTPRSNQLASRLGVAAVLGQREADDAHDDITARPLPVWRSPASWLRAGRNGIVVVDPVRAAHLLAGLVLLAEDHEHARELHRVLRVPPPRIMNASQQRIAA